MNGLPPDRDLPVALPDPRADRLAALFDAHYERLYRLARRLTTNADDALDLVQDTFLKVARSRAAVPLGMASEEAWLVRVLVNIQRDQWRKIGGRQRHDRDINDPARVEANQEAAFIARETVWRALATLPPRRRAVVVMHELEGRTTSMIASLLGISDVTVRWHLSVGRRALARVVNPQMGDTNEDR